MIGILPSHDKTFEVIDNIKIDNPIEGKLYYNENDKRLYYYSTTITRPGPETGYLPIWNGNKTYTNENVKYKTLDDVIGLSLKDMSNNISKDIAEDIIYRRRLVDNASTLSPVIDDNDNVFTQCIKSIICSMNITMVDLADMCYPKLNENMLKNYYSSLTKISFMRLDKWYIWINVILHLSYDVIIFKKKKEILRYSYPVNRFKFDDMNKYKDIIKSKDDSFKKIIKILMVKESIDKNNLKEDSPDDYMVNNLMTTLYDDKKNISGQLFSRFMNMTNLHYHINLYDRYKKPVFSFKN